MTSTDYLKILSDHREIREITRKTLKDQAKKSISSSLAVRKNFTKKVRLTFITEENLKSIRDTIANKKDARKYF